MDLELTDEQRWLSESVETLLSREWPAAESVTAATDEQRRRVWDELVAFGALSIDAEEGIGAVEACLIARSLGAHLASAPFIGSAAARLALGADGGFPEGAAVALALLESGSGSWLDEPATVAWRAPENHYVVDGEKVGVEQADLAELVALSARTEDGPALVLAPTAAFRLEPRASFDPTLPISAASFRDLKVSGVSVVTGSAGRATLTRLQSAGAILAAAEASGAAETILQLARDYAGERRQFGRSIASFQALRHLLADMYVRAASGFSAVLYAAAAFDEGAEDAQRTASVAKAYVSRGARQVAHGAMQVFGGIAFTDEHPAHRFLRRITVRSQQFGDAAHHERALGRALAAAAAPEVTAV
ncbi:MAG: acyl-CoA dehydrogenase family protein [Solirubrobacteraceae bacterium]